MTMSRGRWLAVWLAALLVVVLLAAVAAGLARRAREGDAGALPSATAAIGQPPDSTLIPGEAPTAPAGAEPTPVVDPTDVPGAAQATSFRTFRRHATRAIEEGADLLEALRSAGETFDVGAVGEASGALAAWAAAEAAWLESHPPQACYERVHRRYGRAIDDFGEAAAITEQVAADFPFADFGDLDRAFDLANAGAATMQQAVDLLPGVSC